MLKNAVRGLILASALFGLALGITSTATAQDWNDCPTSDEEPTGCANIVLLPDPLLADFYLDGELVYTQRPGFFLFTTVGTHELEARNVQSTEEGFGTLFTYEDVSQTLTILEAQTREYIIKPQKTYIRGTLAFTCDIHDTVEGDSVACQVAIDGIQQEGVVAAGETASTILDPGEHSLIATLVGEHAGLWAPASDEKSFTIREGKTANVSLRFDKRAHLTVTLDQEGILADYYIDDELVAAQVASIEQWLAPNKTYKVEARNIIDPAAQGLYEWKDVKTSVYLTKGQEKALELRPVQKWLKGFLEITCSITDLAESDEVHCLPTIDDVPYGPIPAGETVSYPLDPGNHNASVAVGPAGVWQVEPITRSVYITAGTTKTFTASFSIHVPVPTPTPVPAGDGGEATNSEIPTATAIRQVYSNNYDVLELEIDFAGLTPGIVYDGWIETGYFVWPYDGSGGHGIRTDYAFTATQSTHTLSGITMYMDLLFCEPGIPFDSTEMDIWIWWWEGSDLHWLIVTLPFVHTWCVPPS